MLISGVQKLSLIDYPDTPACVVFTLGCNFRCGMCHNPEFVLPEYVVKLKESCISEEAFFSFLDTREGLIEGVVITGGEPTVMGDLVPFIQKIKKKGYKVKLDSNGSRPDVLKHIIVHNMVDYIAMDLKTVPELYTHEVQRCTPPKNIRESIRYIIDSGIDHEFRTTAIKEVHDHEVLTKMAQEIKGAQNFYLQEFRPGHTLDPAYAHMTPFEFDEMKGIAQDVFEQHVGHVGVR